jgi:hypothetical protein
MANLIHGSKLLLRDYIKQSSGFNVMRGNPELKEILTNIAKHAQEYQISECSNIYPGKRVNEFGNYMEGILDIVDTKIVKPLTLTGKKKDAGYPDRELKNRAYIECKICDKDSFHSSFRSFYLSTTNKITKSLPHYVISFAHKDMKLIPDIAPHIVDLYDLELTVKIECNTCNAQLYK